ncbi:MAG: cupin-like domain-containing protein [Chitinophagales bacterium]|nr:cupin-like domain-containing protein [Chitinophagales bacterium]
MLFKASKQRLFSKLEKELQGSNRGEVLEHTVIYDKDIDEKVLRQRYLKNTMSPIVFKGVAKDWNCVQNWSTKMFKDKYGDYPIIITDNEGLMERSYNQKFEESTLGEFISEYEDGSMKYLKSLKIIENVPELKEDFNHSWLDKFHIFPTIFKSFQAFIGRKGTMTPVHSGISHTLFMQISGKKKWTLWAANEGIFLNPVVYRSNVNFTNADPYDLNNPNYPLLKYAKKYELFIESGDILWLPAHMWHQVENEEGGIGVAYKFFIPKIAMLSSSLYTILFFFSTKPLFPVALIYALIHRKEIQFSKASKK